MTELFTLFNLLRMNENQLTFEHLTVLLYIEKHSGEVTLKDISKDLTMRYTTAQRACEILDKGYSYRHRFRKGMEYIQRTLDPQDRRRALVAITKEGKNYISSLKGTMKRNGGTYYEHGKTAEIRETARGIP